MALTDQFASRVIISNEVKLIAGSGYGCLTIGTVATKITGTKTETSLFIQAHKDIADVIYLGLDNTVSSAKHFASLSAGEKLEFIVNTDTPLEIWAIGTVAGDKVCYLEGLV